MCSIILHSLSIRACLVSTMTAKVELPKLTDGFLGKQKDFDDFGLSTLSHSDPIIVMDDEHTQVT